MKRFALLTSGLLMLTFAVPAAAQRGAAPPPAPNTMEVVSDLQVRTQRLEQLVEQLTGQLEEMRYQNAQLSKQVQRLQDDVLLRVARLEAAANGTPIPEQAPAPAAAASGPAAAPPPLNSGSFKPIAPPQGYDPNTPMSQPVERQPDMAPRPAQPVTPPGAASAAPSAPGAQVGAASGFVVRTDSSGKPLPPDPNAPRAPAAAAPPPPAPVPRAAPNPAPVAAAGLSTAPANVTLPAGTPKQQYDYAFEFLRKQEYAQAESALRSFLKQNPKDPLAGNAQYWLGESLYVRGDYQAAAQEFLTGYETYPKSAKGPDSLLKLGLSMSHLNQTQGACTALGRIAKEYPDAPDQIRKTAQTERLKLKCT